MTLRPRLVALALAMVVLLASALVLLARSQSPGCGVSAPRPSLVAQLRALGDFDQSYDATNPATLEDAARRAAAALHADLIGAAPESPVAIEAELSTAPSAMVVPLRSTAAPAAGSPPLAGLVVFLRDCQGNAYFASVEDDVSSQPPVTAFPAVGRDQAAAQLGTPALRLAYTGEPLHPVWVATDGSSRSLPAR